MPEHEAEQFDTCAICERTILRGERVVEYVTPDGERHGVCALCRDRAEAGGWVRADSPAALASGNTQRRRRGMRTARLRERMTELGERIRPPRPAEPSPEPEAKRPREHQQAQAAPQPPEREAPAPPPEPDTPERRLHRAIARFNDSEQSRVVAGLMRSLGEPQAAIRDLSARPPKVQVTIAWELSWYRWEVGANGEGAVREAAKGAEVSELGDEELDWNAAVDGEGKLRWDGGS
jgi:hypothetical protein